MLFLWKIATKKDIWNWTFTDDDYWAAVDLKKTLIPT